MALNSDDERKLFEMWSWEWDAIRREWIAPEHGHADVAHVRRQPLTRSDRMTMRMCEMVLSIDDVVAYTRTPEGEGALVGFVMSHGVRKR